MKPPKPPKSKHPRGRPVIRITEKVDAPPEEIA